MRCRFGLLLCWTLVGTLVRGVDGDTFDALVRGQSVTTTSFLGVDVATTTDAQTTARIRLLGIDTPERGEVAWADATAFTTQWARRGPFRVETCKKDSFGRWLGTITRDGESLGQLLLDRNLAVPWKR
jgi:micrococcal nuclease